MFTGGMLSGTIVTSSRHSKDNREGSIVHKNKSNNKNDFKNVPSRGLPTVRKGVRGSLNPFLSDEEGFYVKIADKSHETNSLSFGSDASTQTERLDKKIGCELM